MRKEIRVYLEDILESIQKIKDYTAGISFAEFDGNTEHQDAVIRRLEIVGEAVKNLPSELKTKHPGIPWKQIAGMRDVLIHEYAGVSIKRVWKVVTDDLEPLERIASQALKEMS